jgi:predicted nucleic acid-binding protein
MLPHDSLRHPLSHQTVVAGSAAHEKFQGWTQAQEDCNASSIAWAEFLGGPLDAPAEAIARQIFPHPEPFLPADAVLAARLFNQTGRRSRSLADCMIAAVAIRCGAKLATSNTADFQPFVPLGLILA